ncbi:hypothetical protein RN001_013842 [Aquatica leii]|uniref:Alkylated DNA repair protein alkB homolog 5 n=1 Tax=Aquatica leii TaxID=1421715 RepID=A0AAN7P0L1_9COLE|nr:hypothetical protein RN001_013842 [Aquatica leii]
MDANKNILENLYGSIDQPFLFNEFECRKLESYVQNVIKLGNGGYYKEHSVDRALLRTKYFFGERYTYGTQMMQKGLGMERLYPLGMIDPIPLWLYLHVINPLIAANIVQAGFINSAVINEYQPGGCIVSHIDPAHIFDRPIISISLFSDSALCFGCKFEYKPIRCSEPVLRLPLPRGIVTLLSGFAADKITHCVRPEDTTNYRAVILLRRVLPDAPRLLQLSTLLIDPTFNLIPTTTLKRKVSYEKVPDINKDILQKAYQKYSKARKTKRKIHGSISKVGSGRKTYFADNKTYEDKPYNINAI